MRRVGYDCDAYNKMCVPQPGGLGTYATLGDCQADCGPKCYVPETTGAFITADGFWHPGLPKHGSPCTRQRVSWENIREPKTNPYHLPCMTKTQCETAFNPVDVPMTSVVDVDLPTNCNPTMGTYPTKRECQAKSACLYTPCSQLQPGSCWQCITGFKGGAPACVPGGQTCAPSASCGGLCSPIVSGQCGSGCTCTVNPDNNGNHWCVSA